MSIHRNEYQWNIRRRVCRIDYSCFGYILNVIIKWKCLYRILKISAITLRIIMKLGLNHCMSCCDIFLPILSKIPEYSEC